MWITWVDKNEVSGVTEEREVGSMKMKSLMRKYHVYETK